MYGCRSFLMFGSDSPADIKSLTEGGYEILNCKLGLEQGVRRNAKASTRTYLKAIELILSQIPTMELLEWGMDARDYRDGMIVVLDAENVPVEKFIFKNAACIRFEFDYILLGESYASVKMMIQPEQLLLGKGNDISFTNEWVTD